MSGPGYGPDWCRTWRADVEWLIWFSRGREAPVLARITTPASGTKPEKISDYPREPIGTDTANGCESHWATCWLTT